MESSLSKTPKDYFLKVLLPSVIALIGIAILSDLWVSEYIIPKSETSSVGRVYRLLHNKSQNKQIPIFGSSRAKCSFNPYFMGINAYNYGIDGYPLVPTLALVRNFCDQKSNIPVIINLDYNFPDWVDIVPVLPFLKNKHLEDAAKMSNIYKLHYSIYGIRYFDNYIEYIKIPFKYSKIGSDSSFNGYDYEMQRPIPDFKKLELTISLRSKNPLKFDPRSDHSALLFKLFNDFPKTTFFLIRSPYHKTYIPTIKNYADIEVFIKTLQQFKNVKVIHNFDDGSLNDSCFADNNHVNRLGAQQFGLWLRDTLSSYQELKPYQLVKQPILR